MKFKLSLIALTASFLFAAAAPAFAHHAFAAEFDAKKPVKLRGTVTKMEWINPHTWIYLDVKKPDGTVEEWMVKAGTEVLVDGYQSKDGSLRANGRDLTLPDGKTLFLGSNDAAGAPYQEKK